MNFGHPQMPPLTVNIALNYQCNYTCKFCFGGMKAHRHHFSYDRIFEIPSLLANAGCEKITIEGGEPFLSPYLPLMLLESKRSGLKTCVITNGWFVSNEQLKVLQPNLDMLGVSVDSKHDKIEEWLGRGEVGHIDKVKQIAQWCHGLGIELKLNTVVTACNYREDMVELILNLQPKIWKAFQVLKIEGENEENLSELRISDMQFRQFIEVNARIRKHRVDFRPEYSNQIEGSYIMILPDGHFFNNPGGKYVISKDSIFEVGVERSLSQVYWNVEKYVARQKIRSAVPINLESLH